MGHMLSTMNPEAAAAIDNPPAPPDVGTMVVFHDRPGFSRMHRTEFPAIVLGHQPDGTLILMVILEAEDFKMEDRVPFRSHNQEAFYWRYVRPAFFDLDTDAIARRLDTIESVLASDEMDALEKRVAALEGKKKPKAKGK